MAQARVMHGPGAHGAAGRSRPKVKDPGKLLKRISMSEVFRHYLSPLHPGVGVHRGQCAGQCAGQFVPADPGG